MGFTFFSKRLNKIKIHKPTPNYKIRHHWYILDVRQSVLHHWVLNCAPPTWLHFFPKHDNRWLVLILFVTDLAQMQLNRLRPLLQKMLIKFGIHKSIPHVMFKTNSVCVSVWLSFVYECSMCPSNFNLASFYSTMTIASVFLFTFAPIMPINNDKIQAKKIIVWKFNMIRIWDNHILLSISRFQIKNNCTKI